MNPQCICRCSILAADIYLRLSSGKLFHFNLILMVLWCIYVSLGARGRGQGRAVWASFTMNSQTIRHKRDILVGKRLNK